MSAGWMLYALAVGALLAVAAWALEGALRVRRLPARWVWLAAPAGTLALAGLALAAAAARPVGLRLPPAQVSGAPGVGSTAAAPWWSDALDGLRTTVDAPLAALAGLLAELPQGSAGPTLALGWLALSGALLLSLTLAAWRFRRVRRGWPRAELSGALVRVAPDAGPLVAGVVRPEIVVPRWLLAAPPRDQHLVLAHEREHVRARDPLLLALGCLAVALLPWHPGMWWMLRRLRLAVELDCDARVLRGGVSRAAYGAVLLDVADHHRSGAWAGAPALLESPAQLERRLLAMTRRIPRFALARGLGLATLAALLALAACEASLPSTPEIEKMDVAAAESGARRAGIGTDPNAVYWLDDQQITAAQARALTPERIAMIQTKKTKTETAESSEVRIYTPEWVAAHPQAMPEGGVRIAVRDDRDAAGTKMQHDDGILLVEGERVNIHIDGPAGVKAPSLQHFDGILLVDGKRSDPSQLRSFPPDQIESIEVFKGSAAAKLYDDPKAANGVIRITTKKAVQSQAPASTRGQDRQALVVGSVKRAGTGAAVEGATVRVQGQSRGAVTDRQGRFVLAQLTPGDQTLLVEAPGGARAARVVQVAPTGRTQVELVVPNR